ncbi:hypothetical protein Y032_0300g1813 [Ancylostoma ceylanicum]|nr:hypothetical protein Y032_0300g1813 [Ancylostoma ceylanicum]
MQSSSLPKVLRSNEVDNAVVLNIDSGWSHRILPEKTSRTEEDDVCGKAGQNKVSTLTTWSGTRKIQHIDVSTVCTVMYCVQGTTLCPILEQNKCAMVTASSLQGRVTRWCPQSLPLGCSIERLFMLHKTMSAIW